MSAAGILARFGPGAARNGTVFLVPLFIFCSWCVMAAGEEVRLGDSPTAIPSTPREHFLSGISAYQSGRLEEAISGLEEAIKDVTGWEEYALFYLIQAKRDAGYIAETLGLCKAFQSRFEDSLLLDRVLVVEAEGYQASSAYWLACRTYEDLLKKRDRAEIRFGYARVLESMARFAEAHDNYQLIRKKRPRSSAARQAKKRAREIAREQPELKAKGATVAGLKAEADLCLQERDPDSALAIYRKLLRCRLSRTARRQALGGQLQASVMSGKMSLARDALRSLSKRYPGSREEIRGLVAVGKVYWRKDYNRKALPYLSRLVEQFTDTKEAMQASYILGRIHVEEGSLNRAIKQFRKTRFLYPGTYWETEAAWWEAWCHYLKGDYGSCAKHLEECYSLGLWSPGLLPRALYWHSRCLEKGGEQDRSRHLYRKTQTGHPSSYYGLLAAKRLSGEDLLMDSATAEAVVVGEEGDSQEQGILKKLGDPVLPLLLEADLSREAVIRLDWLRKGDRDEALSLEDWVEAYALAGSYQKAMQMAKEDRLFDRIIPVEDSRQDAENLRLLRVLYPLRYWELILETSEKNQLDPFLVAGLIRQESLFMPDAVSPAGAIGLMQIMPTTGERVADRIGMKGFETEWLQDPEVNIRIGTAYLAGLVRRHGQDWPKILATYNAGPRAVAKWAASMPEAEMDEFVESILYRETRIYVKKVLSNRELYQKLYQEQSLEEDISETPENGFFVDATSLSQVLWAW